MNVYLLTAYERNVDLRMVFIIHAYTRQRAIGILRKHAKEEKYDFIGIQSHDVSADIVRVDTLLPAKIGVF